MKINLEKYKGKLEEEKRILIRELSQIGIVKNYKAPDDWQATPGDADILRTDPNEVANKIENYEGNTALVHELETRLAEVDVALEKMKKGTYGICEKGNEEIEEGRLEANPAAATCIKHMNS